MSKNATRSRPPQRRTTPATGRTGAAGRMAPRKDPRRSAPTRTALGRASVALAPRGHRRQYIALAAVVVVLALAWLILLSPVLGVKQIGVDGATVVSAGQVRTAAAIVPDTPLARIDTDAVKAKVEALPAVASAEVSRSWPNEVVITIHERQPVAVVSLGGDKWVVDITGKVYLPASKLGEDAIKALPPLDVAHPGADDVATRTAVKVIASIPSSLRKEVSSVSATTGADVTLHLEDGRSVIWGGADESKEKASLIGPLLEHDGSEFDISSPQSVVIR